MGYYFFTINRLCDRGTSSLRSSYKPHRLIDPPNQARFLMPSINLCLLVQFFPSRLSALLLQLSLKMQLPLLFAQISLGVPAGNFI
jgi:hypothetical protein